MRHRLLVTRRTALVAISATAAAGGYPLRSVIGRETLTDAAIMPAFRRRGDRDDTASLLRAAEYSDRVFVPAGRYEVGMTDADDLPSGLALIGDGNGQSVIARSFARATSFILHADSRSREVANNLTDFLFENLSFVDDGQDRSYSPFAYFLMLSGVTNASVRNCAFEGFRGDAIYLGSSTTRAEERHNLNVVVSGCSFNGISGNTRNAISVLDCRNLLIEDCTFRDVGRTGGARPEHPLDPLSGIPGPGAIDIEPERTGFAVIDGITIRRNSFSGGGGNAVTMNLFRNGRDGLASNIVVEDNVIKDRFGGIGISGERGDAPQNIIITNNKLLRCQKPFLVDGVKGLTFAGNTFSMCQEHAELGWQEGLTNVLIERNEFERIGTKTGFSLWIRRADGLTVARNRFAGDGTAMAFVAGMSQKVAIRENSFKSLEGGQQIAVGLFAGAEIDRRTLTVHGNIAESGRISLPEATLFAR